MHMRDGFVRVAAATPQIQLADPAANAREVIRLMGEAAAQDVKLLVFPELCLVGATCGDLFFQPALLSGAMDALLQVMQASAGQDMLTVVGLPMPHEGGLYDCAAIVKGGELLGVAPKIYLEGGQGRWFQGGKDRAEAAMFFGERVPFGGKLVFAGSNMPEFSVGVSITGDNCRAASCSVVACPFAEPEIVGQPEATRARMLFQSVRHTAAYVVAGAGPGESTTDHVYAGRNLVIECGKLLAESKPFAAGLLVTELDLGYIAAKRRALGGDHSFDEEPVYFAVNKARLQLTRVFEQQPFVPSDPALRAGRCEQILEIQAQGLAQRMRVVGSKQAIIGASGGLDSTLAMLVAARALDRLGLPRDGLLCVTMPCFGTTERTKSNAVLLAERLGGALREISVAAAVSQHFLDIGQDTANHDVTFENAQARERTQVLMDIANQTGGLVVGTGDLSELALGWATYNGDHMSMYGVNGGVPKTLVRHLVAHAADATGDAQLASVLRDILSTPVSPELLPPVNGVISQKTEELVGPYELHDFFLYHLLRRMDEPGKIKRLAAQSFAGVHDEAAIDKWLKTFLKRFFSQQFKRSCLPDGPAVGSVSVSPRGGLAMPSDAASTLWVESLHE